MKSIFRMIILSIATLAPVTIIGAITDLIIKAL